MKFYGMGTFNLDWSIGSGAAYGHVGDTYGYQSQTTYVPEDDFVITATWRLKYWFKLPEHMAVSKTGVFCSSQMAISCGFFVDLISIGLEGTTFQTKPTCRCFVCSVRWMQVFFRQF